MHRIDKHPSRKSRKEDRSLIEALMAAPKLPLHEWRLVFGDKRKTVLQTAHFKRWQLQEAKAKFSELFDRVLKEGPQVVTRHNKEAVVILSADEYRKLANGPEKPAPGMLETLAKCPKGPGLKIQRDKSDILDLPRVFD